MFTVKAIKENGARDVFALSRYSVHENPASYEVSGEEPGKAEGLSLYVSADHYQHIIIENAGGRNVEHLRLGALKKHKVLPNGIRRVAVTVNGKRLELVPHGLSYENLVEYAGMKGNPTMTIRFGDRSREGVILSPGMSVELDDGAVVDAVHTGDA